MDKSTPPKTIVIEGWLIGASTGRYIEKLLENLQQIDQHNNYIVILGPHNFGSWTPSSANFSKKLVNYGHYRLSEQTRLCWTLYRIKPDLVHFTMPNHPLLYAGKKVITVHDLTLIDYKQPKGSRLVYEFRYWLFGKVLRHGLNSSEAIITNTEYVRQQIISRWQIAQSRIVVIPEASDRLSMKPKANTQLKNKQFLLAVGNAYPYKNLELLITSFAKLQSSYPSLQLVLVGKTDYWYEQLQKYVQTHSIMNVVFTGFVDDAELSWLYAHAEAYVFPSLSEGFGLPGLEAMQFDLPVVSAEASCLPEVYGDAALYFDPTSVEDLEIKLEKVLTDSRLRKELIAAGRDRLKRFSWEKTASATLAVYNQIISN